MRNKKTIELFSGTKSASKVFQANGYSTLTVDNEPELDPDIVADVLALPSNLFAGGVRILWASPPCTGFSVASIGHHWGGGYRAYEPKTSQARLGMELVRATLLIIRESEPQWWFIENPRGVLRKLPFMDEAMAELGGRRVTITYCQYGEDRMKPTDIWTNAWWWEPRGMCKNGDTCHVAAPRGSKTGTQGITGAKERGRIPAALFQEILKQMERKRAEDYRIARRHADLLGS